jgi:acetyl esterase/lipase
LSLFRRHKQAALRWGSEPNQVVDLYEPTDAPRGAVALIHGGFWRAMYGREGLADHCRDLASRGFVAGNVAYRRVGEPGGGFPNTCEDVLAGLRALADAHGPLIGVVGHSAGGQLALWAAKEMTHRPRVVVTVAGVNDMARAVELGSGNHAAAAFTGGDPEKIVAADPMSRLPLGTRTVVITPVDDPPANRELSERYVPAARAAGDDVELRDVAGDHFSILDTGGEVWAAVLEAITAASG